MKSDKTLQYVIDNRMLYESYPMQYIGDHFRITNNEEFIVLLDQIVHRLHRLHRLDDNFVDSNIINKKDLTDIKFYLTEKLYLLQHGSGLWV